jgi:hypothetical protein
MKKENLIAIAIIGGLILLGIGFYLGLDLGKKAAKEVKVETPLANLLASKVIGSLTTIASGEVKEISGRNLTLSKEGDTLTISIREDAPIYRLVPPEEKTATPQPAVRKEIKFGEIKVGDQVSVSCQLKADATLEGVEVTVLP